MFRVIWQLVSNEAGLKIDGDSALKRVAAILLIVACYTAPAFAQRNTATLPPRCYQQQNPAPHLVDEIRRGTARRHGQSR